MHVFFSNLTSYEYIIINSKHRWGNLDRGWSRINEVDSFQVWWFWWSCIFFGLSWGVGGVGKKCREFFDLIPFDLLELLGVYIIGTFFRTIDSGDKLSFLKTLLVVLCCTFLSKMLHVGSTDLILCLWGGSLWTFLSLQKVCLDLY